MSNFVSSIAKYTTSYCHLERCTPSFSEAILKDTGEASENDSDNPKMPIAAIYRTLESPRQYYDTIADGLPPAQPQRLPTPQTASDILGNNPVVQESTSGSQNRTNPGSHSPVQHQRHRAYSRNSNSFLTSAGPAPYVGNGHIDASEPRAFPGAVHERERRRSLRWANIPPGDSAAASKTRNEATTIVTRPVEMNVNSDDQNGRGRRTMDNIRRGMADTQVCEEDTDFIDHVQRNIDSSNTAQDGEYEEDSD